MDFAFTEEQTMILESAEQFFSRVSDSDAIRGAMATPQGYDENTWKTLCKELYFQAVMVPEEHGGLGLGYVELAIIMEQMGRFLVCSPYFSTVCLVNTVLLLAASPAQQETYFEKIIAGETAALAWASNGAADLRAVEARYTQTAAGYQLDGEYCHVIDGHTADFLVLAAREQTSGEIALFVAPSDAQGIERTWAPTVDQTRKQATVTCNQLILPKDACLSVSADDVLVSVLAIAAIVLSAEQMGGAQQLLDMTVAYTKERVQFNRAIASFQAVKHQAADMMTRVEASRSGVYYAACIAQDFLVKEPLAHELLEAASISKAYSSHAYFRNASDAIQLHGGVGFTWEYDVHLYFKRAKASEHMFGDAAFHYEQLAKHVLEKPACV